MVNRIRHGGVHADDTNLADTFYSKRIYQAVFLGSHDDIAGPAIQDELGILTVHHEL